MQLLLKKTDSRFSGHERFAYYIKIKPLWEESAVEEFYRLRHWCWETFGPSREIEKEKVFTVMPSQRSCSNIYLGDNNDAWSWINDSYRARIYLKGKDEAAMFKLKWS